MASTMQRIRRHLLIRALGFMPPRIRRVYYPVMIVGQAVWVFFMNIILAFIMKDVLDAAVRGDMALLERAIYLAVSAMCAMPLGCTLGYWFAWCLKRTATAIRERTFTQMNALTMQTFETRHSGEMVSQLSNDVDVAQRIFGQMGSLVSAFLYGVGALGAIFALDWRFGLLVLALGLLTVAINSGFARPLRRVGDAIQKHQSILIQRLTDLIHSMAVSKMFHLESRIHGVFSQANTELVSTYLRRAHIDGLHRMASNLLGDMKRIGLLVLGLYLLLNGDPISIGTIAAIIHLQGNAGVLFDNVGGFITGIQQAMAGAQRVFELLDSPGERGADNGENAQRAQNRNVAGSRSTVEFRGLHFAYREQDGSETEVLRGVDISVAPGHLAALVGPSGGGKSTLIKLLLGFYPVSGETLWVSGRPVDQYGLDELRSLMAYVPQDAYIFDGTIEENIRYGKAEAQEQEIFAAARAAHAHEFILGQEEGYASRVGERGTRLSGGQRQRIAIARALLKDAPILLLDEATSALDSESEQLVQDALEVLMRGRTTIAIAHRLSTIEHADVIYVLDQGRVSEQGTHRQLLAKEGVYHRLHGLQFRADS